MWKVIVFFAPFLAKFWLMFKKHYKIGISAHFQKQKKEKNDHFEGLLSGPSKGYYLGQVCCNIKMANLAQIITLQIFVHTFFSKKSAETPIFIVFFANSVKKNKLGPDNNPSNGQTYICTFICVCTSLSEGLDPATATRTSAKRQNLPFFLGGGSLLFSHILGVCVSHQVLVVHSLFFHYAFMQGNKQHEARKRKTGRGGDGQYNRKFPPK